MAKLRVKIELPGEEVKEFVSWEYLTADDKKAASWELLMEVYGYIGSKVPVYEVVDQDKDREVR